MTEAIFQLWFPIISKLFLMNFISAATTLDLVLALVNRHEKDLVDKKIKNKKNLMVKNVLGALIINAEP